MIRIGFGATAMALPTAWTDAAPRRRACLDALADTLIPADDTPGALDAGIAQLLDSSAETNPSLRHYLDALLDALDRWAGERHGQPFDALPLAVREALLGEIFTSRDEELRDARTGFMMIREDVFSTFYLSSAGHDTLGYEPPFPRGYPDYAQPPEAKR